MVSMLEAPPAYSAPAAASPLAAAEEAGSAANGERSLLARLHERAVEESFFLFWVHDVGPRALSPKVKGFVQAQNWFQNFSSITMAP
jgi:hypothetical protein